MPTLPLTEALVEHDDHRHRTQLRTHIERLLDLAQHLADQDRLLIEQIYRHGLSATEVARLLGERPDRTRRRITRLLKTINKPEFNFLVRHEQILPTPVRETCRRVFFEGLSLRKAAQRTGKTLHQVRQDLATFHALARL